MEIPKEVLEIIKNLKAAGNETYLVGGCVRDLFLEREPKDWDVTTNAKPEEIQKIFPDSVYENKFGTVLVKLEPRTGADDTRTNAEKFSRKSALSLPAGQAGQRNSALNVVEVTTFRLEGRYTDKRHPDEVKFVNTVEEDLSRRDFTINAIALSIDANIRINANDANTYKLIDPYGGRDDLENRIIKAVGDPDQRFREDALRLMRAVRFAVELDFEIDFETRKAVLKNAGLLEAIAKERIRDEFIKMIMAKRAADGIKLLEELDLLRYVLPELREGLGMSQNKHHIYTVFEHNILALDYAARKNYSLEIRLAALLHDVGKPKVKRGEGENATFYNHEMVGAKLTAGIMDRLCFSREIAEKVIHLVRYHLFYYNVGEVTAAGVRRFLARVGPENVDNLLKIREADRIGSGVPKAVPYKNRHLMFMIEKVKNDPISPKMLKVNGNDLMEILGIQPGPKVGCILNILLEEMLDDPEKNIKENLELRIKNLGKLSDDELKKMSEKARETKGEFEEGVEEEMKKKFGV